MDICITNKIDGLMTVITQTEARTMARQAVKDHAPKGSKLDSFWISFDQRYNEARLVAQYKQPDGWSASVGVAI